MLPVDLVEILALFDGEHSIAAIQAELQQRHGEHVPRENIEQLIGELDEHGFLDSPAFARRRTAIDDAFLRRPEPPGQPRRRRLSRRPGRAARSHGRLLHLAAGPGSRSAPSRAAASAGSSRPTSTSTAAAPPTRGRIATSPSAATPISS